MEELRAKQGEIEKRDDDIKFLEAIIRRFGAKGIPNPFDSNFHFIGQDQTLTLSYCMI
ncbi:hypothetical protein LR48_Vigan03g224800 [Vigna angularis]|uniref:Uncharacterized protein n=1 Tax=Phaseolus angularis TaxID=3914 RepID=A0A0L9U7Z9_PHAAN|nr:hypothetical protein LR48_Vigan03g224800 [Vigna angularis]